MRISDWSADVCSSDLPLLALTMAVDIMPLNRLVGTMAQHAFDHRADLGGRTAFELRVDAGGLALHVPVNHDAPAAVADMPFRHQILIPGPHLRGIRDRKSVV